jgi:aconitate hydratase
MRTCDPEPHVPGRRSPVVASAETLAYAVATGEVGDPRTFKRPVRVTVPRALPTDDVLIARKATRGEGPRATKKDESGAHLPAPPWTPAWTGAQTLALVEGAGSALLEGDAGGKSDGRSRVAVLCGSLDEVREIAGRALELAPHVGAVLATYIPSALVTLLSAAGIVAIRLDSAAAKALKGQKTLALPAPSQWPERAATTIAVGPAKLPLTWLALGPERAWASGAGAGATHSTGTVDGGGGAPAMDARSGRLR